MFEGVILFVKYKLLILTLYIEYSKIYLLQFYGLMRFKPKLPNITLSGNYDDDHILGMLKLGYIISPYKITNQIDRYHNHIPYNIDITLSCLGMKNIRTLNYSGLLEYICKCIKSNNKVYCYGNTPNKLKMKLI